MPDFLKHYVKTNLGAYLASILFSVLSVASGLVPYWFLFKILENILGGNHDFSYYLKMAGLILFAYLLQNLFHKISTSISHRTTFKVLADMRKDIIIKLSKLPLGVVEDYGSGTLKDKLVEKVEAMETPLAHVIPEGVGNVLVSVFTLVVLFILNWKLALGALAIIPVALFFYLMNIRHFQERFGNYIEKNKILNNTIVEYIHGMKVIKTFHRSEKAYEKLADAVENAANSAILWMKENLFSMSIAFILLPSSLLIVLPWGGAMVMQGELELSRFLLILVLNFGVMFPLLLTASHMDALAQSFVNAKELGEVMAQPELDRPTVIKQSPEGSAIAFHHVHFAYDVEPVLKDFSLEIPQGEITALVGPSGSGKSTVAKLVASFYDIQEGEITYGKVNIKDLPLSYMSNQVAYVSQKDFLFNLTIMENLALGDPSKTREEIISICKACGVHNFIMDLEKGYDTMVGTGGGHLSGGERQRISIARAMVKDAPVIIFDEATAYADPENEHLIQQALSALIRDKTVIIIAHRLSTIRDAHNICYLDEGQLKARGDHQKLMQICPDYKTMYEAHMSIKDEKVILC